MTPDPTTVITAAGAAAAMGPTLKVIAEKMLGPMAEAAGEHFGDKTRRFLEENVGATVVGAARKVEASGAEPKTIPLRTAIPLLEGAAREDDPTLRDMWSSLIANTSISEETDAVPPSFAHIMGQFSPIEARALVILNRGRGKVSQAAFDWDELGDRERMGAAIDLLQSLGIARRVTPSPRYGATRIHASGTITNRNTRELILSDEVNIELTTLGKRFLAACTTPAPA